MVDGKEVTMLRDLIVDDTSIMRVVVPDTVKIIGEKTFFNAQCLMEVEFEGVIEEIKTSGIVNNYSLEELRFKEGLTKLEEYAISYKTYNGKIHMPASIGYDALEYGFVITPDVTVYGPAGSEIESYCELFGYNFIAE